MDPTADLERAFLAAEEAAERRAAKEQEREMRLLEEDLDSFPSDSQAILRVSPRHRPTLSVTAISQLNILGAEREVDIEAEREREREREREKERRKRRRGSITVSRIATLQDFSAFSGPADRSRPTTPATWSATTAPRSGLYNVETDSASSLTSYSSGFSQPEDNLTTQVTKIGRRRNTISRVSDLIKTLPRVLTKTAVAPFISSGNSGSGSGSSGGFGSGSYGSGSGGFGISKEWYMSGGPVGEDDAVVIGVHVEQATVEHERTPEDDALMAGMIPTSADDPEGEGSQSHLADQVLSLVSSQGGVVGAGAGVGHIRTRSYAYSVSVSAGSSRGGRTFPGRTRAATVSAGASSAGAHAVNGIQASVSTSTSITSCSTISSSLSSGTYVTSTRITADFAPSRRPTSSGGNSGSGSGSASTFGAGVGGGVGIAEKAKSVASRWTMRRRASSRPSTAGAVGP